jgi:hypothetical protein
MANISVTMNVTSVQDVYLKAHTTDPATNGIVFVPNASVFQQETYATFSNFVSYHQAFQSLSGDTTLRKNADMKWDSSGIGDVLHTKWFMFRGPAIIADTANGYEEAYYINNAAFRLISWLELKTGQLRVCYYDDVILQQQYMFDHVHKNLPYDPYVHRFDGSKALMQQYSASNVTWCVPICDQFSRANKLNNGWFQYLFARQAVEWKARFRNIRDICCHVLPSGATTATTGFGTATDTSPLVWGTSRAVLESDFQVEMWGTFYILDPNERQTFIGKEIVRHLHCVRHETYVSNESAGTLVQKDQVTMNDPTKGLTFTFQPDSFLDGTMPMPYNPGLKHPYVFIPWDGASGLDEWFVELNWFQNGLRLLENNPIQFLRNIRHAEMFNEPSKWGGYELANQPLVQHDILIHTVNQSRIDKLAFSWKKNTSLAGSVHYFQYYVAILNAKEQIGGVPFQ